jgi:demethylspheroidene O-methyltransferase
MNDRANTGEAFTRLEISGSDGMAGARTHRRPTLRMRLRAWRNGLIASSAFRARMMRLPGLRWVARRKANALFRLTSGFVSTQVLSACVALGVFDKLRASHLTTAELADACDLAPDRMELLLQQAERLCLVDQVGPGLWMLDDAGAVVASDPCISAMVRHHDLFYRDLAEPVELLRSREPDTRLKQYWAYARSADPTRIDPETAAAYSALMHDSQAMLAECILAAHDFGRYDSLLDVGGGDGTFLTMAAAANPALALKLFDLPSVIELSRRNLTANGLIDRAELHGGDFTLDPIPDTASCVCLIRVLCDHDDDRAMRILENLHRHLKPGTRVMIAEAMAGDDEGAKLAATYFSFYFLAMGSGRCRSDAEIKNMLGKAGFQRPYTVATPNPLLATLVFAQR